MFEIKVLYHFCYFNRAVLACIAGANISTILFMLGIIRSVSSDGYTPKMMTIAVNGASISTSLLSKSTLPFQS